MKRKIYALVLCLTLATCSFSPVVAYAEEETTYEEDGGTGTREAGVSFEVDTFTVRLPKNISGKSSSVSYEVGIKGSIPEGSTVSIIPQKRLELTSEEGYTASATVSQEKIIWIDSEISADEYATTTGEISSTVVVGKYDGTMTFEISLKLPGLYGTDGSFTPWDTLIANGSLTTAYGGIALSGCSNSLTGELRIHTDITQLTNQVFYGTTLTKIVFPPNLTTITTKTFRAPSNLIVEYQGVDYTYGSRPGFDDTLRAGGVQLGDNWWDWND